MQSTASAQPVHTQCTSSAHAGHSFRGMVWPHLQPCSPALAETRFVTGLVRVRSATAVRHCRYDELPLLLPELRFSWVPHKYFLVSPGSMGRTVAAKHVQANYERGGRLHQHANSPSGGGRRQSAAEKELGTSFDEGMLLMATARRHVYRMHTACAPHVHRMYTACAAAPSQQRIGGMVGGGMIEGGLCDSAVSPATDCRLNRGGGRAILFAALHTSPSHQAELIAGARAVVGTLTSNFGLLLHDLAARQHNGTSPFVDLDNNNYYSCNVRVEPPWGPLRGRPKAVQDRLAFEAYRNALSP